jgi:hypothetical protein
MKNKHDSKYFELIKALQKEPDKFDYQLLRQVYPKTSFYDPYSSESGVIKRDMFAAFENRDYENGAKQAKKILDKNYLDMDAHMAMSRFYGKDAENEKADFHIKVMSRLLQTIKESGDGTSMETAFKVLSTEEEYFITAYLGGRAASQALKGDDEHRYDVLTMESGPDNKEENVYFNIDIPFGWLQKKMQKE